MSLAEVSDPATTLVKVEESEGLRVSREESKGLPLKGWKTLPVRHPCET